MESLINPDISLKPYVDTEYIQLLAALKIGSRINVFPILQRGSPHHSDDIETIT